MTIRINTGNLRRTARTYESKQAQEHEKRIKKVRTTITDIRETARGIRRASIEGFYTIGRILLRDDDLIVRAERSRTNYQLPGSTLEAIANEVGIDAPTLSKCRRFAATYDESEVEALLNRSISWSHIRLLVNVNSDTERRQLVEQIEQDNLSADELAGEILRRHGSQKPGAGRRAKPPATPHKALRKLNDWLTKFRRRTLNVLFDNAEDEFDLPTEILTHPPDELTEELLEDVAKCIVDLRELAAALEKAASGLDKSRPFFNCVFAERERADAESVASQR